MEYKLHGGIGHSILVPILQIKKLKFREVGELGQVNKKVTGREWYPHWSDTKVHASAVTSLLPFRRKYDKKVAGELSVSGHQGPGMLRWSRGI